MAPSKTKDKRKSTGRTCRIGMHTKNNRLQQRKYDWTIVVCIAITAVILNADAVSSNTVAITSGFEKRTLNKGENFTLQCKATGLYHVTITWLLDGLPLEYETQQTSGSVKFTADNPHAENSRFLIKNSNERNDDVSAEDEETKNDADKANANDTSTQAVAVVEKRSDPGGVPLSDEMFPNLSPLLPANTILSNRRTNAVSITSELTLQDASVEDGGVYTCFARDVMMESVSWSKKISVLGSISIRQNPPKFALIDSVVIIPCTVLGTDKDFEVRWFYKKFQKTGRNGDGLQWIPLPNDHRQTVHENGSFEIRDARKTNEGIYRCEVDMVEKTDNMSTALKVMVPPKIKSFSLAPVQVGETVGAFCIVTEGDLPLDIIWGKDGKALTADDAEMHPSGKRALSLAINSADLSSAGNYSCCAQNNVSRACVTSALVVLDAPQIHGLPASLAVISGTHVTIPCHATGFPKPNVTWMRVMDDSSHEYKNVAQLRVDHSPWNASVKIGQFPNGTLLIANISSAEAGKYLCRAVNKVDELSSFVALRVNNPARILSLTGTDDVIYESDVTMECASWGDGSVDVQWFVGGMLLSPSKKYSMVEEVDDEKLVDGEHSITLNNLLIKNSSRADTGRYSCQVSNEYGSASRDINIVVRAPPSLPSNFEVIDKGTSFLRMMVTPGEDDGGSKLQAYVLSYNEINDEESTKPEKAGLEKSDAKSRSKREATVVRYLASTSGDSQELVLDYLDCGRRYDLKIRTENEIGLSFGEMGLVASTIGSDPVIPAVNELVVDVNQTAAVLDLRAWQNGGCPFTAMTIEYARHGDTEWNVTKVDEDILGAVLSSESAEDIGEGVKNPGHVIITNLQIGTWYKIWTSACNNAGCNFVTHSVATLQKDGATVPPLITEVEKKQTIHTTDARFLVPMVCGFGLVLLLVVLLLFYRYKQRSKKQRRLKEAKKMANSLLYKTDKDQYASPPPAPNGGGDNDGGNGPGTSARTNASSLETSPKTEIVCIDLNASADSNVGYAEPLAHFSGDTANETLLQDSRHHVANSRGSPPASSANCSKGGSTASSAGAKISLTDKEEFAVFRDDTCSDDETAVTSPLVCDESAFSDVGTWSYFHPNSKDIGKKYTPLVAADKDGELPRRVSSSSSGTDEELAEVFGLTSSKKKPLPQQQTVKINPRSENSKPKLDSDTRKSSTNHTSKMTSGAHSQSAKSGKGGREKRPSPRGAGERPKTDSRNNEQYYTVGGVHNRSGLPNPVGILYPPGRRTYQHMPENSMRDPRRANGAAKPRHGSSGQNPFRPTAHHAYHHIPPNLHRFVGQHAQRGHTYSSYPHVPGTVMMQSAFVPPHGYDERQNPPHKPPTNGYFIDNSSPFGERQWVDTYDSQYGTARSKRPSWGSTDLDKEAFYTPPSSNVSGSQCEGNKRDKSPRNPQQGDDVSRISDVMRGGDVNDNHIDMRARKARRLESSSPRDSGIGSDDAPSSVMLPRSAPTSQGPNGASPTSAGIRRIRNSIESPTDSYASSKHEQSKHDSGIRESKSEEMLHETDDDFIFPISPPPSPPEETRLAPHAFVDISTKSNTSPNRSARSSYPPSLPVPSRAACNNASYDHLAGTARIGDFMPTPPQSGPTSPADHNPPHSKQFRPKSFEHDGWRMTNLDNLGKYKDNNSDPYLTRGDRDHGANTDICDTTYAVLNEDNTWLASTLV